ncbi:MAG TPA: hypothetical protein PLG47_03190 [Candidatus Dojkabacteria bacterium]|nr:hypothetical protein [Candidatus Dojkabacteria bacterium]
MNQPKISYYAKMVLLDEARKTPKYRIIKCAGFYPPMEALRNNKGFIDMYLMEKLKEGDNVPAIRLQARDSLNFTGLKEYYIDNRISGYAYGYPMTEKTYSKYNKPNPFYKYQQDGFLFIIHQPEGSTRQTPDYIELIVLDGAKVLIPSYCKQLTMSCFDEQLEASRRQAQSE